MPDAYERLADLAKQLPDDTDDPPLREKIVDAVLAAGVVFWGDEDANAFASVPLNQDGPDTGPVAHYRVAGKRFANVVRRLFGAANPVTTSRGDRPGAISDGPMTEALAAFGAMALSGETRTPAVRLAEQDGAIWIDLGDATHRAVKVTAAGWGIVPRADAPLIRPDGLRALPVPLRSANALSRLEKLLNLEKGSQPADGADGKGDFRLVVAWLVSCLFPTGPFPIMALDGEQGSGKSTTARMLRRLVDPNAADLRAMPRNEDDLLIAATNGRVVALDNVSYIDPEMADALCRVATGAGFGKRALYTDLGEIIVSVSRPILLNGIPSLLARGDLADRAIAITLPAIPDDKRLPETEVRGAFDAAAPAILALLLDGLVAALKTLPTLKIEQLPRMADFARLACAAAPAFGWTQEQMLAAMQANREAAVTTVVESDPIAVAVQAICSDRGSWPGSDPESWTGSATLLLEAINMRVPAETKNERGWPRDGARLSHRLKRAAPALRRSEVEIIFPVAGGRAGRTFTIRPQGKQNQRSECSQRSAPDNSLENRNNLGTLWNADGGNQLSVSAPDLAADQNQRSQNGISVPERSANYMKLLNGNAGNTRNADSAYLGGVATSSEASGWEAVI